MWPRSASCQCGNFVQHALLKIKIIVGDSQPYSDFNVKLPGGEKRDNGRCTPLMALVTEQSSKRRAVSTGKRCTARPMKAEVRASDGEFEVRCYVNVAEQ